MGLFIEWLKYEFSRVRASAMIWSLFIALSVYNILDAWHTECLLRTGLIEELNPIGIFFLGQFPGYTGLYVMKLIALGVLFPFVLGVTKWGQR